MVRNGSGGDPILTSDVPRIIHALEALDLMTDATTIAVDDRPPCSRASMPCGSGCQSVERVMIKYGNRSGCITIGVPAGQQYDDADGPVTAVPWPVGGGITCLTLALPGPQHITRR